MKERKRVEKDELLAARIADVNREKELRLKAESVTRGQISPCSRRARESVELSRELTCASKALTEVRRAALQELLLLEHQQHSEELSRVGKAFYTQRI
ncbi:hypothetical protein AOXY_G28133 [Acipenser oxyrinchus oxyrinchus]|uniref:Uncharacterized protein n=1 Tax=Acipenser oxyrinchus oxyrinchus TaxID=40147 RepID=A0AAD8CL58_ACIOX|nr:hypothetical protein AOXY_G32524 [Acipenser oxyrinchus oxyrinchus]KAK1154626.1 hypothetical protein AOXY_G28133 [Acipenser oxyrinchus oxyrinchus]